MIIKCWFDDISVKLTFVNQYNLWPSIISLFSICSVVWQLKQENMWKKRAKWISSVISKCSRVGDGELEGKQPRLSRDAKVCGLLTERGLRDLAVFLLMGVSVWDFHESVDVVTDNQSPTFVFHFPCKLSSHSRGFYLQTLYKYQHGYGSTVLS